MNDLTEWVRGAIKLVTMLVVSLALWALIIAVVAAYVRWIT